MTIFQKFTPLAAAIFMLATSSVIYSSPAAAYQCKSFPTQSIAFAKVKGIAKIKARNGWSKNVKTQFGLAWSNWNIAKAKSISCSRYQGRWRCLANAKPCLYTVQ